MACRAVLSAIGLATAEAQRAKHGAQGGTRIPSYHRVMYYVLCTVSTYFNELRKFRLLSVHCELGAQLSTQSALGMRLSQIETSGDTT